MTHHKMILYYSRPEKLIIPCYLRHIQDLDVWLVTCRCYCVNERGNSLCLPLEQFWIIATKRVFIRQGIHQTTSTAFAEVFIERGNKLFPPCRKSPPAESKVLHVHTVSYSSSFPNQHQSCDSHYSTTAQRRALLNHSQKILANVVSELVLTTWPQAWDLRHAPVHKSQDTEHFI